MIRTVLASAALLAIATVPARAADDRLVSRVYDSNEVVRIAGKLGVQATIGFGENESIENVAIGDAESWQITPNKRADLLFVKPLAANARTNMTVVTDKHTYFFDLVASPSAKPLYMLRFTYKAEPKPASAASQPGVALNDAEQQVLAGDLAAAPVDPALLNFSWARKGDSEVLPARVYDDGDSTYLLWSAKQQVPAILMLNEKGEEGPVNYAVRGSTIVIDNVPSRLVLRMGKKSGMLSNQRPAARSTPPAAMPAEAAPVRVMPAAAPVAAVAATDPSKR